MDTILGLFDFATANLGTIVTLAFAGIGVLSQAAAVFNLAGLAAGERGRHAHRHFQDAIKHRRSRRVVQQQITPPQFHQSAVSSPGHEGAADGDNIVLRNHEHLLCLPRTASVGRPYLEKPWSRTTTLDMVAALTRRLLEVLPKDNPAGVVVVGKVGAVAARPGA